MGEEPITISAQDSVGSYKPLEYGCELSFILIYLIFLSSFKHNIKYLSLKLTFINYGMALISWKNFEKKFNEYFIITGDLSINISFWVFNLKYHWKLRIFLIP